MDENDSQIIAHRSQELFGRQYSEIARRTDRMFAGLMAAQWLLGIVFAIWISPRAWAGMESQVHIHVYAAIVLGGIISAFPMILGLTRPGLSSTRHVIAIGQMLTSALLIHLTGGRIETHFHVFGSLAFLAFYRDWRVLATATAIVALDHGLRGIYWPQSVYGVSMVQSWRVLEHTGWVLFEDGFLCFSIIKGIEEMRDSANRQALLEETNKNIERKIAERTEELAKNALELGRSNSDLEQFAYAASHDLREPLRKVASFTQLLSQRYGGKLDSEADSFITRAVDGAQRMMLLIDSLLQYSRVGRPDGVLEQTDVGSLLKRVLADLELPIQESGAVISCGPLPTISARPAQLAQVFQNLIGNALKFHGKEPPRISVNAKRGEQGWTFCVQDNGIGIDPKFSGQLFTMFRRLHRSEYPGTGIGLAICKKIVERHGGSISVESQPGQGSNFSFVIPALDRGRQPSYTDHVDGLK